MTVLDTGAALGRRLLRPKPVPAPAQTIDHLVRPRLLADVVVHPPIADGSGWMAQRGENHYFRLGTDLARLASAIDGTRDHAALARVLGAPWTSAAIGVGVAALDRASLLQREQPSGAGARIGGTAGTGPTARPACAWCPRSPSSWRSCGPGSASPAPSTGCSGGPSRG